MKNILSNDFFFFLKDKNEHNLMLYLSWAPLLVAAAQIPSDELALGCPQACKLVLNVLRW